MQSKEIIWGSRAAEDQADLLTVLDVSTAEGTCQSNGLPADTVLDLCSLQRTLLKHLLINKLTDSLKPVLCPVAVIN